MTKGSLIRPVPGHFAFHMLEPTLSIPPGDQLAAAGNPELLPGLQVYNWFEKQYISSI